MDRKKIIGIDLGTSSVKTIIMNQSGKIESVASNEYGINIPKPGFAEQDPNDWYLSAIKTIKTALNESGATSDQIEGIGLSGQMHGLVCLDGSGKILRPAIIWADQRSSAQVKRVYESLGFEKMSKWTGNPLSTGFMLASWLWIVENEPDIAQRTTCLLLPKDYLRYKLTGLFGSEPSDASSTSMFDIHDRVWSQKLLDSMGIDKKLLPKIYNSESVSGGLSQLSANDTGLLSGTPVIFCGADQAMQAIGRGVINPGSLSCAISTGGTLITTINNPYYDPGLRIHCMCHALPNKWYLMAATLSAGLSLRWLRDSIIKTMSYNEIADLASNSEDTFGLLFLPHLIGERTPYMDPNSKAAFYGLTPNHHLGHMARSVMEGVVYSLRLGMEVFDDLGIPINRIIASGGGTRHPFWLELMSNIFGRIIEVSDMPDASAVGAAMLAGVGTGLFSDIQKAYQPDKLSSKQLIKPNPEKVEKYSQEFLRFKSFYPAVRNLGSQR